MIPWDINTVKIDVGGAGYAERCIRGLPHDLQVQMANLVMTGWEIKFDIDHWVAVGPPDCGEQMRRHILSELLGAISYRQFKAHLKEL